MKSRFWNRFLNQYWFGIMPGLLVLIYRDFIPKYLSDDPVRLVSLRRVYDPSFLSHEWLQLAHYDEDSLSILFKVLFAPLWLLTKDAVVISLISRAIVWTFVLYTIVLLARALTLPRYALAIGFFYWIDQGQSLGAGEWIFGDAEGKCLAYGTLFLALESLVNDRPRVAAVFCGLAFWFHVPVSLWAVIPFYIALIIAKRNSLFHDFLVPLAITAVVSLPMGVIAFRYMEVPARVSTNLSVDWLIVIFRNPHHMDPHYFHGWHELATLTICGFVAAISFSSSLNEQTRLFLRCLLLGLVGEFFCGVLARETNHLGILKAYPFRVADVLVFFLACLTFPSLIGHLLTKAPSPPSSFPRQLQARWAIAAILTVLLVVPTVSIGLMKSDKFFVRQFATSWAKFERHQNDPYQDMTTWVRTKTPANAIIIAPPWLDDFTLESERPMVVDFRRNPHNGLILEWYERYCAMNGGTYDTVGVDTERELRTHYDLLTAAQISEIHRKYDGTYYLTTVERHESNLKLVHADAGYYLYQVSGL